MASLNIKLVKSLNGRHKKHIATAHSIGLRRIGDETSQPDNPQTKGKLAKICYLVMVTNADDEPKTVKSEKTPKPPKADKSQKAGVAKNQAGPADDGK